MIRKRIFKKKMCFFEDQDQEQYLVSIQHSKKLIYCIDFHELSTPIKL